MSEIDYSKTVQLPRTDFPMRANLPEREPEILKRWQDQDLPGQVHDKTSGRDPFILHDGPPYANGQIHIGHALNYILKDTVCRMKRMEGYHVPFINGSDCHGLPIEWKIEEKYRAKKKDKDEVPVLEFREECRNFAKHWIEVQREDLKRLAINAMWDKSYNTMTNRAESIIAREIGKFLMSGSLYRGYKSVMWSVVEKTALAEAEVEYHDHTSVTIHTCFPVKNSPVEALEGAHIVIWTTTPWTIPANRALAYGKDIDYVVVEITAVAEDSIAQMGQKIAMAEALLADVCQDTGISDHKVLARFKGAEAAGTVCQHPFNGSGYEFEVPMLAADFVTTDQGTGFVHIAPGHGEDDFVLGQKNGIEVAQPVLDNGIYEDSLPLFAGLHVYKAHDAVCEALQERGMLLGRGQTTHSYPHSWRSKAPLIFRATPQWFISMEHDDLRQKALAAIKETRWFPAAGENRITAMVENRPDWCISRQRAWGVPIPVFVDKKSGEPLRDQAVMDRIVEIFKAEGSDAWFSSDAARFLGDGYNADDYEQVDDIVDVWFESGSTHAFVMEDYEELSWPADLYLEGSDQHRGWFQSSLMESVATRGRAPYNAVLTHGFVMDGEGRKMSKSLGNTVVPQTVIEQHGADILRLWVADSDYHNDLRISDEILKGQKDIYRRLRNTLRFLLGNLTGYTHAEAIEDISQMPSLERWVLHRLTELDGVVRKACDDFDFHEMFTELHTFCASDLSSFYFDIRKDSLYCDRPDSLKRRSCRTVLYHVYMALTSWLAPVLCFTMEETWDHRPWKGQGKNQAGQDEPDSVHLRDFYETPQSWQDAELAEKWQTIRRLRRVVTGALEVERANKTIGSSLESNPLVYAPAVYHAALADEGLTDEDLAEICITSQAELSEDTPPSEAYRLEDVQDVAVLHRPATGKKCERCWKTLPDVGSNPDYPTLSARDAEAVAYFLANQDDTDLKKVAGE